jgi:MFS family permease
MALFVGLCLALFNNYTGWSAMGGYLTRLFEMNEAYTHGGTRAAGTVTFSPPAPESERAGVESQRAKPGSERAKAESERTQALFQNLLCWSFMGLMTLLACGLVDRLGRRPLWIAASLVMIVANVLMGGIFFFKIGGWLFLPAVCLCAIPHSFALGPLPWLMMSEIFPTRIRARAVAITTAFIWAVAFAASAGFPVLCGFSEHLIGSIAGAFWLSAAACVLSLLFGVTLMPETKGKTLEEIGEMWKA